MSNQFSGLIIKAPFLFVKGFLLGFMHGRNMNFDYFFHRKSGIKRETLGEIIKELPAIDCYTDLCLPNNIVDDFEKSLKQIDPGIGVTLEDKRKIKDARFTFSFKLFNMIMPLAQLSLFFYKVYMQIKVDQTVVVPKNVC